MSGKKFVFRCEGCLKQFNIEREEAFPVVTPDGIKLYCEKCCDSEKVAICRNGHPVTAELWQQGHYGFCPICEQYIKVEEEQTGKSEPKIKSEDDIEKLASKIFDKVLADAIEKSDNFEELKKELLKVLEEE